MDAAQGGGLWSRFADKLEQSTLKFAYDIIADGIVESMRTRSASASASNVVDTIKKVLSALLGIPPGIHPRRVGTRSASTPAPSSR